MSFVQPHKLLLLKVQKPSSKTLPDQSSCVAVPAVMLRCITSGNGEETSKKPKSFSEVCFFCAEVEQHSVGPFCSPLLPQLIVHPDGALLGPPLRPLTLHFQNILLIHREREANS